jgi:hypothetical protein
MIAEKLYGKLAPHLFFGDTVAWFLRSKGCITTRESIEMVALFFNAMYAPSLRISVYLKDPNAFALLKVCLLFSVNQLDLSLRVDTQTKSSQLYGEFFGRSSAVYKDNSLSFCINSKKNNTLLKIYDLGSSRTEIKIEVAWFQE